ncbi:MAG: hypothetical protein AAB965_01575 [Patescibacteria group bacterium]
MLYFTKQELSFFKKLNTPAKVQGYLNSIPINFEKDGVDTLKSPIFVVRQNSAHCLEGAMLGAYILSLHGHKPLLLHLETDKDFDHVIVPFKENNYWGALSKTNHAVLRYREPIYKNLRELVMSYFHEYFTDDGKKTLRRYSHPLNLNSFEDGWECAEGDLWGVDNALDEIRHYDLIPKTQQKKLNLAAPVEREAGKIVEWKKV